MARAGADTHVVSARVRRHARARAKLGVAMQAMMVDILEARNAAAFGPAPLGSADIDAAVIIEKSLTALCRRPGGLHSDF